MLFIPNDPALFAFLTRISLHNPHSSYDFSLYSAMYVFFIVRTTVEMKKIMLLPPLSSILFRYFCGKLTSLFLWVTVSLPGLFFLYFNRLHGVSKGKNCAINLNVISYKQTIACIHPSSLFIHSFILLLFYSKVLFFLSFLHILHSFATKEILYYHFLV